MINIVAFVIAVCVYLFTWAMGVGPLTALLIPVMILVGAAAVYTYTPLLKKSIHGDDAS